MAFIKRSGTRHIAPALATFAQAADVEIIAGVDHGGTSLEGLRDLLEAVSPTGRVLVFHNRLPFTFHPKLYLFKNASAAEVLIGSGNLTEGGLFTNYEAGVSISLDLARVHEAATLASIERTLDGWADLSAGNTHVLNDELLDQLVDLGIVPSETSPPASSDVPERNAIRNRRGIESLFAARSEPNAPSPQTRLGRSDQSVQRAGAPTEVPTTPAQPASTAFSGFVMTLQQTDAGVGQISTGTARRSPEIFVPLAARDACPSFWGWPDAFEADEQMPDKHDRRHVRILLGDEVVEVNMMTWPPKHDFRLRSEALRSAGSVGSILRMERAISEDYEYEVEVIPPTSDQHAAYLALCSSSVRNSEKKYGYY